MKTQCDNIREHLESGKSITPIDALNLYGCFRLGARIADLKKQGMHIHTDIINDPRNGKRYASYRLVAEKGNEGMTHEQFKAKKIYMVCGMMVTEEEFNRVCRDEGVSDFPKRVLKPKMRPCDEDEFEIDPGPWQEVEDGHSWSRVCNTGDKVLVETIVKES